MTKQTIEVEGLPEGWKAVAYRYAYGGEYVHTIRGIEQIRNSIDKTIDFRLIVEKIQPRRIVVLENTGEVRRIMPGEWIYEDDGRFIKWDSGYASEDDYQVWREVKETDTPLTDDEPKLSLSVDECKSIIFAPIDLHVKLEKFIKGNS